MRRDHTTDALPRAASQTHSWPPHPRRRNAPGGPAAVTWVGPREFARQVPVDGGRPLVLDTGWGPRHDQSLELLLTPDGTTRDLYAYDPTWDEYAVLGHDIPLDHVLLAVARVRSTGALDVSALTCLLALLGDATRPLAGGPDADRPLW